MYWNIDNDTDGIRNMKFTQEYYNKLQEHYNDILNDMMTQNNS